MACYISSNNNRFYVGLEQAYGNVAAITAANRIPAVQLGVREERTVPRRRDKTGTRTNTGVPTSVKSNVEYSLATYMMSWQDQANEPAYGALFRACLGGIPLKSNGGAVSGSTAEGAITFGAAHGLSAGQAVSFGSEIRFVMAVVDSQTILLNAPFTMAPGAGAQLGKTVTYPAGIKLPSVSIFDYWSPAEAVQRVLAGCGIDKLEIDVNGDYHGFRFSGPARELVDNSSFTANEGQLTQFPEEPAADDFDYTLVPGHLGQAWLGSTAKQCYTLTAAKVTVDNGLNARSEEFGTDKSSCLAPGQRKVQVSFSLYAKPDDDTKALYQAARQRSPISVMLQLGQESGQLFGVYIKSFLPAVPSFDDGETRLQWNFGPSLAQGTGEDEIYVAFA